MKRIALLAAALASGCVVSSEPPPVFGYGDVVVYWNFSRHTLVAPFTVLYDGNVNPGGPSRACADSGVEYVTVTDVYGTLIDPGTPTIPCVYGGVQGATFLDFTPGTYTFVVHGYRTVNSVPVEVHRGQGSVYVYENQPNPVTVTAAGLQANLDVFLYEGTPLFTCVTGDTLGYTLQDTRPGTPTTIDQVTGLACGNPIAFRVASSTGVDLDGLDIRVQVTNGGTVVLDSCVSQPFGHFGNDISGNGWAVALYATPCP